MARLARLVVAGLPHHVTQRGNRRQQTFFCEEEDYAAYVELMADWCKEQCGDMVILPHAQSRSFDCRSAVGGWPARAIGEAHRRYTRRINFREKWRGYLWQGRFASFVMDEPYLLAAARYVELNPVRAGLVHDAADWRWSSARSHLSGRDDRLVRAAPMLAMVADWRGLLNSAIREEELRDLREHVRTGRPLGSPTFVERLERTVGRILRPQRPGRPSKLLKRP